MQKSKRELEQEKREKFRAAVCGMSDQRLTVELEKRRKLINQISCQGKDERDLDYQDALLQFGILSEVIRDRLGSRPRAQRMQTRTRRGKYGGMNK